MASADFSSSVSQAELAICRLVEETSGHETLKFLGPGCLTTAKFLHSVGTPNSSYFLVASNLVLPKSYLKAIADIKEKSKRRKDSVKIVAEFLGTKDRRSLERKPLSDLYRSLEEDVFEINDITFVGLTKIEGRKTKNSLSNRSLEAYSFTEGNISSLLASDQLQCLVFCDQRSRQELERNVAFSIRPYDLLQFDSVLACDDSRFPKYFLRSEEKKRYLTEDEFEDGKKPFGAVIVSKDYHLAGFLNFVNKKPAPLLAGIKSGETLQHGKIETELPVGACGGVYPMLPGLPAKSDVRAEDVGQTSTGDNTPQLTETTVCTGTPVDKFVAELKRDSNGNDLEEKIDQEFTNNGGLSPTEHSYHSIASKVLVVNLPAKNGKDKVPAPILPEGLSPCPLVPTGATLKGANNVPPEDRPNDVFPPGYSERRRHSFPSDLPKKEEHAKFIRSQTTSGSLQRLPERERKIQLGDPLAKTILGCLELLEGLCRCLDKEYRYGANKCWKHVAEYFDIDEEEYQNFKCSQVHSPTEVMFEYLQTCNPDITVSVVKDGLHSIARQDVISVLVKYEQTYHTLNDDTLVCSLFDSDPDIIGEMAFLLDMQKQGLKNWSHLAAKLDIPRKVFRSFETCNTHDNPTEGLFELLKIQFPRATIGGLIGHLEALKRQDVVNAIRGSSEVTDDSSLITQLMEDLDAMDNVCDLLNQKLRTKEVKGWRHLGRRYGIKKESLDDLSPIQEEIVCPSEALIRYLGGSKPWLTIQEFIWAIHKIGRNDALAVVDVYLPDRCIPNLLTSCHCVSCQVNVDA